MTRLRSIASARSLAITIAASVTGIRPARIYGNDRSRTTMLARKFAYWLVKSHGHYSLTEIAREFGRDHSSILKTVQRLEADCAVNSRLERLRAECARRWEAANGGDSSSYAS